MLFLSLFRNNRPFRCKAREFCYNEPVHPDEPALSGGKVQTGGCVIILLQEERGTSMLEKPELKAVDEEIYEAIELEKDRQQNNLEMIASEKSYVRRCHGSHGQRHDQ
jgi:hypothetical protein